MERGKMKEQTNKANTEKTKNKKQKTKKTKNQKTENRKTKFRRKILFRILEINLTPYAYQLQLMIVSRLPCRLINCFF